MRKIVVVGGGVAGMSVAHELLERGRPGAGFDVHVLEAGTSPGGKARSIPVPGSGTDGRPDLPGEHGFRFFPGFYRHLPDTLSRIPANDGRTVFDHLVPASRLALARSGQPMVVWATRFPQTPGDVFTVLGDWLGRAGIGLPRGDVAFFGSRIWQLMTSCRARRLAEYEQITWWSFVDADARSDAYRHLLAEGLSRSLLANDPRRASARTVGNTYVQLLLGLFQPGRGVDRLLDGPTSEVWLEPWLAHLRVPREGSSFRYDFGARAVRVHAAHGRISGVTVTDGVTERRVEGDRYVFSLPVERMASLMRASAVGAGGADLAAMDPGLSGIASLHQHVAWMNGIQFFLYRPLPIVHGHCLLVDSPWALTAIAQAQFWPGIRLGRRGNGTVRDVLSVCISNWDAPGIVYGKPARRCTRHEIAAEVWAQLKTAMNGGGGAAVLRDDDLHDHFLDPDVHDAPSTRQERYDDLEPLLVNATDTWRLRPDARTAVPNLFLAADYVQTNTDVACMEAANEAARRAVNAILDADASDAPRCRVWELAEPAVLRPLVALDQLKFAAGLPWSFASFASFASMASFAPSATAPSPAASSPAAPASSPASPAARGSAAGAGAARYVDRGGEQCHLPPYACDATRLFGFFVEGDTAAVQRSIVDPQLNDGRRGGARFHAISRQVLVTFAEAGRGRSVLPPDDAKGWTVERSCTVWVPIAHVEAWPRFYAYVPYIVVDNAWSLAAGREVYGYPKAFGTIDLPAASAPPDRFTATALALAKYGVDQGAEPAVLVQVRRVEAPDADVPMAWRSAEEAVGALASHVVSGAERLAADVLRAVSPRRLPSVFLKQFRDAADGSQACFKAILEAYATVTSFRSAGLLPGRFEVEAADFDSHPIARDLGLRAGPVPVELSFFVDFDFTIGAGREIWRAPAG